MVMRLLSLLRQLLDFAVGLIPVLKCGQVLLNSGVSLFGKATRRLFSGLPRSGPYYKGGERVATWVQWYLPLAATKICAWEQCTSRGL